MLRRRLVPLLVALGLGLGIFPLACGKGNVPSPFGPGAGGGGGEAGAQGTAGFALEVDAGEPTDTTLGGPCEDDGQCDDDVDCTSDVCDPTLGRCRFEPDDSRCDNGTYCDGVERCDGREGCTFGEPVACSDGRTCTIDVCVEETRDCRSEPRDADGDGDPTHNCDGTDCDDENAAVNTAASEICGNQRDDNCDGGVDEAGCTVPEFDDCAGPLEISEPGYYALDLVGTALNYPSACARELHGFRDAVLSVQLPEGGPFDLDISARADRRRLNSGALEYPTYTELSLSSAAACGQPSESCQTSFVTPLGGVASRLLLRGLAPGVYPIYLGSNAETMVDVEVQFRESEAQQGDQCEQALTLVPDAAPLLVRLPSYVNDFDTACEPQYPKETPADRRPPLATGEAFMRFSLEQTSDVTIVAEAENALGIPLLALLDSTCQSEQTCRRSQPGRLFARSLPAGEYRVALAATGPDDISVRLETSAASASPAGEGCGAPLPLEQGKEALINLSTYADSVHPGCEVGGVDASFSFELDGPRDVALIGRFSDGDEGGVSIFGPSCADPRACRVGAGLQRVVRYALPAGEYRALIESLRGNPVGLSWFERPALAAVQVPFADDCEGLVNVPEVGGRYSGNTSNAFPDFSAGCDEGGQDQGGAPDQILKLRLSRARRVIFDMQGSSYQTMLSIRAGKSCPGDELPSSCAAGYRQDRSYLDLDLDAGDYFIQIDGFGGDSGQWKLDIFTAPL